MKTTEQILQRIAMAQQELENFTELRKEERLRPRDEQDDDYISMLKTEINALASELLTLKWVLES